jgi:hypothetical protein
MSVLVDCAMRSVVSEDSARDGRCTAASGNRGGAGMTGRSL